MLLDTGELYDMKCFLLASYILFSLETRKVQFYLVIFTLFKLNSVLEKCNAGKIGDLLLKMNIYV